MQNIQKDVKLNYLDASFPFFDGCPLPPHLSHNDGKKLDLAFIYRDNASKHISELTPSWFGYGGCEIPLDKEIDMPSICAKKGKWQYNLLYDIMPTPNRSSLAFDEALTKQLVLSLVNQKNVHRLFLEPHLKQRLNLTTTKVRFHGCQAVRHDDHIHIEVY